MTVRRLYGAIRSYAWGSRSFLAGLQGRAVPSPGPEAELWLGAHPGDPAMLAGPDGPVSLADAIGRDPDRLVGSQVAREYGGRLPFLLKVLAAEAPLSLQAHPDAERARAAFRAGHPCYVDECHKPEMLVALTPFDALCGFRPADVSADVLAAFGVADLAPVVSYLRAGPAGLRQAVGTLLCWPEPERKALLASVVEAAVTAPSGHPYADAFALVGDLAAHYPDDPGVLVAMLLNHVRLEPGEAIWMPAGNLHAYLRGAGVEIMAASDNVLRGGLTPKRVDVPELLRVLRFEVLDSPVVAPVAVAPGVVAWQVPAREFVLHRITVQGGRVVVPVQGPRVALCVAGEVTVTANGGGGQPASAAPETSAAMLGGRVSGGGAVSGDGAVAADGAVVVPAGGAAFVSADGGPLVIEGRGELFVAAVGD